MQLVYGVVSSAETACRRVPDHVSVSRIAYFKRKFVDDDDEPPFSFRTYCQTVSNDALKLFTRLLNFLYSDLEISYESLLLSVINNRCSFTLIFVSINVHCGIVRKTLVVCSTVKISDTQNKFYTQSC